MRNFFLFSCLFISLILSAQGTKFGLKTGLNLADVATVKGDFFTLSGVPYEQDFKHDLVLKLNFGVWGSIPLSQRINLQPELQWTQKAYKPNYNQSEETKGHTELNYLSVPLFLVYQFDAKLGIALGPEIGYLFNQRLRKLDTALVKDPLIDENEIEIGIALDAHYIHNRLRFGLRGQFDLTSFMEFELTDVNGVALESQQTGFRNQLLQAWVGYQLN